MSQPPSIAELQAEIDRLTAENQLFRQQQDIDHEAVDYKALSEQWIKQLNECKEEDSLYDIFEGICSQIGVNTGSLSIYNPTEESFSYPLEYPNGFITEETLKFQADEYPWLFSKIEKGETVKLCRLDDLPKEAETDRHNLETLERLSSLIVPIRYEDRTLAIVCLQNYGRDHDWQDHEMRILENIAYPLYSAYKKIQSNIEKEDSVSLLHNVIRTTHIGYGIFNHDYSNYRYSFNIAELLGYPSNTIITPSFLSSRLTSGNARKDLHRWWEKIINKEDCASLKVGMRDINDKVLYFNCSPRILARRNNRKPKTIVVGYSNITKLTLQNQSTQWLNTAIRKLYENASEKNIENTLKEAAHYLGATNCYLQLQGQSPINTPSSNSPMLKVGLSQPSGEASYLYELLSRSAKKQEEAIHFSSRENIPEILLDDAHAYTYLKKLNISGTHTQAIYSHGEFSGPLIFSWTTNSNMPTTELLTPFILMLGDACSMAYQQIEAKELVENSFQQEQWLNQRIDELYRSGHPVEPSINNSLAKLCQMINAERAFIRYQNPDNENLYDLVYEWRSDNVPSIRKIPALEKHIDLKNLPDYHILLSGETQIVDDINNTPEKSAFIRNDDPTVATLMLPLYGTEGIKGYLAIDCISHTMSWTAQHKQLAQSIGNAITMAHDRETIHNQLLYSRQRFSLAMSASQDGIWDWNVSTGELYLSPSYYAIIGYQADELPASEEHLIDTCHPDDKAVFVNEFKKLNTGQTPFHDFRFRYIHKNGRTIWIYAKTTCSERDEEGNPTRLTGVISDISDFVAQQQELERARLDADQANHAKGDFLARMSHEIRTPMNAIIGMSHLIKDDGLEGKQLDKIQHIDQAAHNLLGIINDILDFSKIESGKLEIENVDFEFDKLAEQITHVAEHLIQNKAVEIVLAIDANIPKFIKGDPLRLNQVLTNLVSNAAKFTETGNVIIGAELKSTNSSTSSIEFCITDTGIGIAQEKLDFLFSAFTQADGSTSRKYGGTGLGLTIVKRLVELMGGEIKVQSHEGYGSCFRFTLAFDNCDLIHEIPREHLNSMRTLVVDDNNYARGTIAKAARDLHLKVETACSAEEAFGIIQSYHNQPDKQIQLILMDYKMPEIDGIEAAEKINSMMKLQKIPTMIMVSAYEKEQILLRKNSDVIDGFITKPISPSGLHQVINDCLSQTKPTNNGRYMSTVALTGMQVLLVEDNIVNQKVAQGILKKQGITCFTANDGIEAVQILKSGHRQFDAILMDIEMPNMDGHQATKAIRNELKLDIPIIAMTAHAMRGDKEKCLASGMNDYTNKPILPDILYAILNKYYAQDL